MTELKSTRDAFGEYIVKLAREDERIVMVDADSELATAGHLFHQQIPERFFEMGIAEQNVVGVAAGLASMGKIAFASTYAVFGPKRAFDQFAQSCVYSWKNVKLVGGTEGYSGSINGPTHHSIEDVAAIRALPGVVIVNPADAVETEKATRAIVEYYGPVYFRIGRDPRPILFGPDYEFQIGRAAMLRDGRDVTLIAAGAMVAKAMIAAEELARDGIQARVLDMATIKPIDRAAIVAASRETGAIVTIENHNVLGGLGSAVAEVLCDEAPAPLRRLGMPDRYAESGQWEELYEKYGLAPRHIVAAARELLGARRVAATR